MSAHFDTDVAIIGYGPSGVSASLALGSRGVKAIAFERNVDIYARARAVTMNDVTLRNFQSVGLADALIAGMDETHSLRTMTFDRRKLNHVQFPHRGPLGFATSYSIYQPVMEQTMRDGAAQFADHVAVEFGQEVVDLAQDADGVTLTVRDLESGDIRTVRARYALACDGGSSRIRDLLGIRLLGDTIETKWVIIDAFVKRWWPDRHVLTFWSDRHRPVVDIALSLGTHRWELPLSADETEVDFATHDQLWALLATMGVTPDDVEIHQHAFYKHHVRRAERWQEGRVFLVGDAAHLMPPWAGQGMQSGIRDVFNLGWKLAEVLADRLPPAVLATFEPERAPDVERYTRLSVELGRIVKQELSEAELAAMAAPENQPPEPPLMVHPRLLGGWITGTPDDRGALGRYIPQPRVALPNGRLMLLDDALGKGFTLLGDGIDPVGLLSIDERRGWDGLNTTYRAVRSPNQPSGASTDIIDLDGTLLAWMRARGARVIALRPDRFVAATDATGLAVPGATQRTEVLGTEPRAFAHSQ